MKGLHLLQPLPKTIHDYFVADSAGHSDVLVALFAPHASVRDEGKQYEGHAAIRSWTDAAHQKYSFEIVPTDMYEFDGRIVVKGTVSGTFDGSPVDLMFRFRIASEKIESLEITL